MRSGAGTTHGIILTIPKGSSVSIHSSSNGWSNVSYNGKTGWVSAAYLNTMVPVETLPTVPEVPKEDPVVVEKPAVLLLDDLKASYDNVNVTVMGRAVTKDGVKDVTATVNGKAVTVTRYERPELNDLYKDGYTLSNLGFSLTIDKSTLSAGRHILVVKSTALDGTVKQITTSFYMTKPQPVIAVSGLTDGQSVPGSDVSVSGYALNADGVTGVNYFVNGVSKGAVSYGAASTGTGAYSSYTGYQNANYSFILKAADLSPSKMNSVRIELTGKDGTVYARTLVLRGTDTANYVAEAQANTRDFYANLESKKSVAPKVSNATATLNQIQYHMDPGNYLHHETDKYMFMNLRYKAGDLSITAAELNGILANMGVLENKGQAFLTAAETYGVNPFYLISHAIHETGRGTSILARGQYVTDTYTKFGDASSIVPGGIPEADRTKLVYNVFGIGAWDVNANLWGAQKAYTEKWFTVDEAIMGGAKWISEGYINRPNNNQNTLFKMRFNFPEKMEHEYATDLGWSQKQAARIKAQIESYEATNKVKLNLTFMYPTFKN